MILNTETKYEIEITSNFKKQYKKILKQGKDISKFVKVIKMLTDGDKLKPRYKDHVLINDKYYKNCRECHIEPDWLLIYQYCDKKLILVSMGSHSELFKQ